jgi:hypothetical protein
VALDWPVPFQAEWVGAPMRNGTLFRRMRSVASTGGVIWTTFSVDPEPRCSPVT